MKKRGFNQRREQLEAMVSDIIASFDGERIHQMKESESIDFKEEAGRRQGRMLQEGDKQNQPAATKLANEVACFANTPGGGVLIVGVEDKSGRLIGTNLDIEWLCQAIHRAVDVAPDIVEHYVGGFRLLVIYVVEAREPIINTGNQLRWRVGDTCVPVDRAQWWEYRARSVELDISALPSTKRLEDVRTDAVFYARKWSETDPFVTDEEFLRTVGVLRSDGFLSEAGALVFTPLGFTALELTTFDVPGGAITSQVFARPEESLLEQVARIENVLEVLNTSITIETGFAHNKYRRIPATAVREAILNGVIHRDWQSRLATEVRWFALDSTLTVTSPGGFPEGITSDNILNQRKARYPALADVFRAITLVDKQGVGVDRMYRDMISMGHNPPQIVDESGINVVCTLVGGVPVLPVLRTVQRIRPSERQDDYRIAIILYELIHRPFFTLLGLAHALQSNAEVAAASILAATQSLVEGAPIIRQYKDAWVLGDTTRASICDAVDYLTTSSDVHKKVVWQWMDEFGEITSGDMTVLTGVARGTVKRVLDAMVADGVLKTVGAGRAHRYVRP